MVIAFGSFPIGAVVGSPFCSFCVFSFCYLHAVHLGAPPKDTTTRLKATARAPLGVVAWWCCVISLSVRLCVLVQILPFAIARDNGISRVCSSE